MVFKLNLFLLTLRQRQFNTLALIDQKHFDNGILRLVFHDDREAKQAYVLVATTTHPNCHLSPSQDLPVTDARRSTRRK